MIKITLRPKPQDVIAELRKAGFTGKIKANKYEVMCEGSDGLTDRPLTNDEKTKITTATNNLNLNSKEV